MSKEANSTFRALKLALEALETLHNENMDYLTRNKLGGENNQCMVFAREAITALREALAQDVPEVGFGNTALDKMAENARELGLDYEPAQQEPEIVQRVKRFAGKTLRTARNPNITARECIELANWIAAAPQPAQQEPVACANGCRGFVKHSPQTQRTWVGLTDDEMIDLQDRCGLSIHRSDFEAIEAKLRNKNEDRN